MVALLAILTEAFTEYIKTVIKMFKQKDYKTAITQISAIAIAVFLCVITNTDIFKNVIDFKIHFIGEILSGIIISRGANYVSDLLKKLNIK